MWDEPVRENGARVDMYWLEGRTDEGVREKKEANFSSAERLNPDEDWVLYYNGTMPYWIMTELSPYMKYQFRVKARNMYGWSDMSEPSEWFSLNRAAMLPTQELGVVVWVLTPLAVLALVLTLMCLMCTVFTKREKKKKTQQLLNMNTNIHRPGNTDVELANLRNFIQNTNIPTDREIALLPHIRREHITLTKFLGRGAFGEVFEGKAKNLPESNGAETRVAVKTLRKGASQQEKLEFLREAQLMSNFKHENILQLLGVCLDNDPNFIIMELMEGGDLPVYLRLHRPLITTESNLTLLDLLSMCVDVARGCKYLEEMHFVHRDLACRNCLVSSTDPHTRIVKIGDFGLARDIYKNGYYRKEGKGLFPVRWMAPESLVDGVFTSQSDVWAFGVLLWEIMSLGQQPYPARSNLEVLHYVRNGGWLGRPPNCCQEMYELMLRCWSYNPEERPMFIYCLDVLMELKRKTANGQAFSAPEVPETVDKKDFAKDTSDTTSKSSHYGSEFEIEFEVVSPSEEEGKVPFDSSSYETDLETWKKRPMEESGSEVSERSAWADDSAGECGEEMAEKYKVPTRLRSCLKIRSPTSVHYCSRCYKVRKDFFPPRPKLNKRKKGTRPFLERKSVKESPKASTSDEKMESGVESCSSRGGSSAPVENEGLCNVCYKNQKNGAFVHCRWVHIYACYECSVKIWFMSRCCPLCNGKVNTKC